MVNEWSNSWLSSLTKINRFCRQMSNLSGAERYQSESIMAQTTIAYLERRYQALEKEIANALHQSPTDDLAIADLQYRKLIIADEKSRRPVASRHALSVEA
jgi:hypothetical protein